MSTTIFVVRFLQFNKNVIRELLSLISYISKYKRLWMLETRQGYFWHVLMLTDLLLFCSIADLKQAHSLMEKSQI